MKLSKTYRLFESSLASIETIKRKTNTKTDTEVIENALQLYDMILIGAEEDFFHEETKRAAKFFLDLLR